MTWHRIAFSGLLLSALAGAQTLNCDFQGYKPFDGLKAAMRAGSLELTWQGERGQTLRAILGVDSGQPVVRELAVGRNGKWSVLGHGLTPEFQVATGRPGVRGFRLIAPAVLHRDMDLASLVSLRNLR